MTYEEKIIWHEVIKRIPTEEEKEEYLEVWDCEPEYILDCVMPDDGQEILIATKQGVDTDVCGIDEGYYLENRGDWDDVIAWAEMPKYKVGEQGMTVKEIIDKLSEYNSEAKINVVVDGFERPFKICFGYSEGIVKTNCETVNLMVGDIGEAGEQNG